MLDELQRGDSALVALLNSLFDGIYVTDRNRNILFWNRGAERMTGYSQEEVLGRSCRDDILNHIDEKGTLLCRNHCPLVKTLATGENVQAKVYPKHKDGRRFPVMTHIAPLRDEAGEIVAAIEVFRDMTTEEDFRVLQEKFNAIIRKYVSTATLDEVQDQLESGAGGRARMRDLSILYLDVVGFTAFAERHTPEETAKLLNDLFGICEVITRECYGDIDKFIGDSVMAVFVDANDAVAAGIRVLEALHGLNRTREEEDSEPIRIRLGINSGPVMQGEIGTSERKDVTVVGDAVNTASRIETAAGPMQLCISEATYARLGDPSAFEAHRTVEVKNRAEPVSMFRYVPPPASPR